MKRMTLMLETLSPVIVTAQNNSLLLTATQDYFTGGMLRGVFANKYIQKNNLGKEAHKDALFRDLFFKKLKFTDALPVKDAQRSFALPLSLQMDKAGKRIRDLLTDEPQAGFKSLRGIGFVREGVLETVQPLKTMQLHMSRCYKGERQAGKSSAKTAGNIYNYEALAEGQTFIGDIIGDDEALEMVRNVADGTDNSFICRLGRSKFTQYGTCRITLAMPEPLPVVDGEIVFKDKKSETRRVFLRMETPFIPEIADGMLVEDCLREIIERLNNRCGANDIDLDSGRIFTAGTTVKNFVGTWGMKRPEKFAVAPGSVFALKKETEWTEHELAQLNTMLYEGVGRRTEEGFGQLRIWQCVKLNTKGKKTVVEEKQKPEYKLQSNEVKAVAARIIRSHILEQVRNCAATDASLFYKTGVITLTDRELSTHLFGELETLLEECKNQNGRRAFFKNMLEEELEKRSEMNRNLERIRLYDVTMYEWILLNDELPHPEGMGLAGRLNLDEKLQSLLKEIESGFVADDTVYFEYWQWFFRHARKRTKIRKGDR